MPLFVNPGGHGKGGSSALRPKLPTPNVAGADRRFPKQTTVSDGNTAQPLAAPIAGTPAQPPPNAIDAGAAGGVAKTGLFGNTALKTALFNLRPNRFSGKARGVPKLI